MRDWNYFRRNSPSSRKLRLGPCHLDLPLFQISSCCAGMPFSRNLDSNHKFSASYIRLPLRDRMFWDRSQKCCSNGSGASDKQTEWRVHLWPSRKWQRTRHQPRPARWLTLARLNRPGCQILVVWDLPPSHRPYKGLSLKTLSPFVQAPAGEAGTIPTYPIVRRPLEPPMLQRQADADGLQVGARLAGFAH